MGNRIGDERIDALGVRRAEDLEDLGRDIFHRNQTAPERIVEIVVDVGDAIGDPNHLAFQRIRCSRRGVGDAGAELGMTENAVANRKRQVETAPIPFQMIDYAKTLLVVAEAREGFGQGRLTGVPKWGVTKIVPESDRLDEILERKRRSAR